MPGGWIARSLAVFTPVASVAALALLVAGCGGSGGTDHAAGMMQAGPGMMGYVPGNEAGPVRSLAAARRQADRFGEALSLHAGEVMRFTNGFYAELLEAGGEAATEVLIDPGSGAVWIEYGPAMMWNTRYGMMGSSPLRGGQGMMGGMSMMGSGGMMGGSGAGDGWGMMGGRFRGDPTWTPYRGTAGRQTISPQEAESIAARWLAANARGLTAAEAEPFPGYFTVHTLRGGKVEGMLSVNAYTGAVWYHWWHDRFVAMEE